MFACLCVCSRPISSRTAGPIWLNFFLLAPSWSRDGFRPKKFRIRDPVFPEIRKNPDFENFENIGTFGYSYKIDHNSKTDGLFAIFFGVHDRLICLLRIFFDICVKSLARLQVPQNGTLNLYMFVYL